MSATSFEDRLSEEISISDAMPLPGLLNNVKTNNTAQECAIDPKQSRYFFCLFGFSRKLSHSHIFER